MTRKWKDSRGFTLVETLCAVAILVMLGLLINTGLHLAMRSYRDLTAQSELELLAASLTNALSDELRYAQRVETEAGNKLAHYHSERYNMENTGATTVIGTKEEDGQLYANDYRILPSGAYGNGTYIIPEKNSEGQPGFQITYQEGLFTVDLTVKQAEGELSTKAHFTVRCLNPQTTP